MSNEDVLLDLLGKVVSVGDFVAHSRYTGRGLTVSEVVKINEKTITVRDRKRDGTPYTTSRYIDIRSGKYVQLYDYRVEGTGVAQYTHKITGEVVTEKEVYYSKGFYEWSGGRDYTRTFIPYEYDMTYLVEIKLWSGTRTVGKDKIVKVER